MEKQIGKTNYEGARIDGEQLIHEPTHVIGERFPCIDLMFTFEPNLVVESGAHPSLHQNCYHQIVFARFNLKVVFQPPYER